MTDNNAQRLVDDIEQYGQNLTNWEVGFVQSIGERLAAEKPLTEKQRAQLLKVHAERVE